MIYTDLLAFPTSERSSYPEMYMYDLPLVDLKMSFLSLSISVCSTTPAMCSMLMDLPVESMRPCLSLSSSGPSALILPLPSCALSPSWSPI